LKNFNSRSNPSRVGAMTGLISAASPADWDWRVPFLLGLLIGPVGFFIRTQISETTEFTRGRTDLPSSPLLAAFRFHNKSIAAGFGITITWTVTG
jgi:MFS transporter, MHS family, proline/betaine transporter